MLYSHLIFGKGQRKRAVLEGGSGLGAFKHYLIFKQLSKIMNAAPPAALAVPLVYPKHKYPASRLLAEQGLQLGELYLDTHRSTGLQANRQERGRQPHTSGVILNHMMSVKFTKT